MVHASVTREAVLVQASVAREAVLLGSELGSKHIITVWLLRNDRTARMNSRLSSLYSVAAKAVICRRRDSNAHPFGLEFEAAVIRLTVGRKAGRGFDRPRNHLGQRLRIPHTATEIQPRPATVGLDARSERSGEGK